MAGIPRFLAVVVALLGVAACQEALLAPPPADPPSERPLPSGNDDGAPPARSGASVDLERFYARVEANLVAQGLLRRERRPADAPFTAETLVQNFERIALFEEYANIGGRLVARQTESRLHRWDEPIRLRLEFGDLVDEAKVARDRVAVTAYASRLSRVTGVPIRLVRNDANFHVFIVTEDERRALGPRLRQIIPGISAAALETVIDLPRSSYCLVFAWDPQSRGTYERAVAIIRAEHPDLLRLSCIHEEIAQGLGLSNDSPTARPSVFNDDEEFALLTEHDELLLRLLYDDRLQGGMSRDEAMPLVREIAAELAESGG